jgi:hypothetical protein
MTEPAPPALHHDDQPLNISRATRIGLRLFAVYFLLFAGFLFLNIFAPAMMARVAMPVLADHYPSLPIPNLAIVYGMLLILAAILLAFYYMHLTRPRPARHS